MQLRICHRSFTTLFGSILFVAALAGDGQLKPHQPLSNAVVLIIRHAEKPEAGDGLAPQGEKRAQAYVNYFKSYQIGGKPAKFSHLFAASDSAKSHRPRLTIEPFANATHSKIDLRFSDKEPDVFAKDLTTHDYGTAILVSWRHGKIPDLLKAIGADPKKLVPEGDWPDSVFDRVVELHFDAHGKIDEKTSRVVLEHLLPGDEKTVGH